ncbi:MAG: hypothetical protein Q8R48_06825, partial [Candidatus Omnitrophota bacterium]|nr:hypothetical protein [Candidatus Omnitrophota bacterium]
SGSNAFFGRRTYDVGDNFKIGKEIVYDTKNSAEENELNDKLTVALTTLHTTHPYLAQMLEKDNIEIKWAKGLQSSARLFRDGNKWVILVDEFFRDRYLHTATIEDPIELTPDEKGAMEFLFYQLLVHELSEYYFEIKRDGQKNIMDLEDINSEVAAVAMEAKAYYGLSGIEKSALHALAHKFDQIDQADGDNDMRFDNLLIALDGWQDEAAFMQHLSDIADVIGGYEGFTRANFYESVVREMIDEAEEALEGEYIPETGVDLDNLAPYDPEQQAAADLTALFAGGVDISQIPQADITNEEARARATMDAAVNATRKRRLLEERLNRGASDPNGILGKELTKLRAEETRLWQLAERRIKKAYQDNPEALNRISYGLYELTAIVSDAY